MRYLNKIILINSANINYAEIELNGSVILNGNQGAGKSTLLRAILFFYTGEKKKWLGIEAEKDSFDEFYLKYTNSYVLYEVVRDQFTYTVLVYRHQGKAMFRFIDSAFNVEWFRDENKNLLEWPYVQKRIAPVHISSLVKSVEQYKSIIYGDAKKGEFSQYSITDSTNYANIPRAIQNVFLNDRIDADFIKTSLINSLTLSGVSIDLDLYRRKLANFKRELDDVRIWYKQNPKSKEYPNQILANQIVEHYRQVLSLDSQLTELWEELNYALPKAETDIIELDIQTHKYEGMIQKEKKALDEMQKKYTDKLAQLKGEVISLDKGLDECKRLKKFYQQKEIDKLLALSTQEKELEASLAHQESILETLQHAYSDIKEKYQKLEEQIKTALTEALNNIQEQDNQHYQAMVDAKAFALAKKEEDITGVEKQYETDLTDYATLRDNQAQELQELRNKKTQLSYIRPYENEIKQTEAELLKLASDKKDQEVIKSKTEGEIKNLQDARDLEVQTADKEHAKRITEINAKRAEIESQIKETEAILEKWDNTFYHWLEKNKPDWQDNIGRVIDEERILLSTDLTPSLSESAEDSSLYGVNVDVSVIESSISSLQEYEERLKQLKNDLARCDEDINRAEEEYKATNERLKKEHVKKISEKKQQQTDASVAISVIDGKITKLRGEKARLIVKGEEEVNDQKRQIQAKIDELSSVLNDTKAKIESIKAQKGKEIDAIKKRYNNQTTEAKRIYDRQKEEANEKKQASISDADQQIEQLHSERNTEYSDNGADVERIKQQEKKIEDIKSQLGVIQENRGMVEQYKIHKSSYLDKETSWNNEVRKLKSRIDTLDVAQDEKKKRLDEKIDGLTELHRKAQNEYDALNQAIEKAYKCQEKDSSIPSRLKTIVERIETDKNCGDLVEEIHMNISSSNSALDSMKKNIGRFKALFSPGNTFKFPTEVDGNEDYLDYGKNLHDFIEFNKAEDFRHNLNEHYAGILSKISREVDKVTSEESLVERLLNDINRDFEGKRFVQAIKSIKLRKSPIDSPIMTLLREIKAFEEEHQDSIGELTLFSGEDRDKNNEAAIEYLQDFYSMIEKMKDVKEMTLQDTFQLQFRINENGNESEWLTKLNKIGSNGTDILVKTLINIMLISVFKKRSSKCDNFAIHCVMDEIGTLFPSNIKGLLQFAAERNIYLVNGAPMSFNTTNYHYAYIVSKDDANKTKATLILNNHNAYENVPNTL